MLNKELLIVQTSKEAILDVSISNHRYHAIKVSLSINGIVRHTESVSSNNNGGFRVSENVNVGDVVSMDKAPRKSVIVQLSEEEQAHWKITGTTPSLIVEY